MTRRFNKIGASTFNSYKIFLVLGLRVCVVHPQEGLAAVVPGKAKVDTDCLSMADMEVTVLHSCKLTEIRLGELRIGYAYRLGRESRDNGLYRSFFEHLFEAKQLATMKRA